MAWAFFGGLILAIIIAANYRREQRALIPVTRVQTIKPGVIVVLVILAVLFFLAAIAGSGDKHAPPQVNWPVHQP